MSQWKDIVYQLATDVEEHFERLKQRLNERLRRGLPICIVPYMGFGTRNSLHLKGRVMKDRGVTAAEDNDSVWENLLNMYRRFDTVEIGGARLRAQFHGHAVEVITDDEGYYHLEIPLTEALPEEIVWHEIAFDLVDYPGQPAEGEPSVSTTGLAAIPPSQAQFGVISDIDDTVMKTNAVNVLKMARNVFLQNAHTRLPFEGVAAFYRALQLGTRETFNPIFYLSSSPWNIYDLLVDFFELRNIPTGPLMLVDYGINDDQFITPGHHAHKSVHITTLLNAYSQLPFILIGDSGQKDQDIYLDAVKQNPGRILAVYIRDVHSGTRPAEANRWAEEARAAGTEWLLVADTEAAAQHAVEHGYILPQKEPEIAEERQSDKDAPTLVEQLVG